MKTTRSKNKAAVAFCCTKIFHEICETSYPRIRLHFERDGRILLMSDDKTFSFCPFCGERIRTTLILANKEVRKVQ